MPTETAPDMLPTIYLVAGARPNFMKLAPMVRAFEQGQRLLSGIPNSFLCLRIQKWNVPDIAQGHATLVCVWNDFAVFVPLVNRLVRFVASAALKYLIHVGGR